MTTSSNPSPSPQRGEIWWVNFNSPITAPNPSQGTLQAELPTTGDEIYKTRPAVVMNITSHWNLELLIVVPVTKWQDRFARNRYFWMVRLPMDSTNKLRTDSAANAFQIKSVSIKRFKDKVGVLTQTQVNLIAATVAYCIGYSPPKPSSWK